MSDPYDERDPAWVGRLASLVGRACGCHMEPVNDATEPCDLCSEATEANNGVGWRIVRCPLHAAAPDLAEALKGLLRHYCRSNVAAARAALAKAGLEPEGR